MDSIVYRLEDFTSGHFPFQLQIRTRDSFNCLAHAHDQFQICYVRKGACKNRIGNNEAVLAKGDLFSVPPFLEHRLSLIPNQEIELVQIDFAPVLINESMHDLATMSSIVDFAYLQPIIASGDQLLPKLNMSPANQMMVGEISDNMQRELYEQDEDYKLSIRADLLRLLIIAGREYRSFIGSRHETGAMRIHRRAFFDTVVFIRQHYREDLKLDDMASMASMSPSYFSHMFKIIMGSTMTDFVAKLRLHKAMELLRNTDMSVTDIHLFVGFNHSGHFAKMFRRLTGVTPMQYRRS